MSYQNKTFVSFDGDSDMHYYRLMTAWKQNDNLPFNFYNAHDLNAARDSSSEESIKAQLAERLRNSKVFVLARDRAPAPGSKSGVGGGRQFFPKCTTPS